MESSRVLRELEVDEGRDWKWTRSDIRVHQISLQRQRSHGTTIHNSTRPYANGDYPDGMKTSIEQCIPKKVEDLRPTKLRRITLFNAQLNHNKKLIGKRMMSTGERNGTLAAE